jgi:DNA-binding beta-propeller fold protein YncE
VPGLRPALALAAAALAAGLAVPATVAGASAAVAGASAFGPSAITQLTGRDGCLMQPAWPVDHGCARAGGLLLADSVALAPDERFVYVGSGDGGVAVFARDPGTGALEPAGCVSATGGDGRPASEGACGRADGLVGVTDVAISPDGRHAYVTASGSAAIAVLNRDPSTGALTAGSCLKDAPLPGRCALLPGLAGAAAVAVSADGASVYVTAGDSATLHVLARDPGTGALTPVQCLSATGSDGLCEPAAGLERPEDLALAPDGRMAYVAGGRGVVTALNRDPATGRLAWSGCLRAFAPRIGPCEDGGAIAGARGVAVSPDSRDVYVAASGSESVAGFRLGPDGALHDTGCVTRRRGRQTADPRARGSAARCELGTSIWAPREIAVSADGTTVVAGGLDTITTYHRWPGSGAVTQTGCAEEDRTSRRCRRVRATAELNAVAVTGDGRDIYVTSARESAVTILRTNAP